MNLLFDTSVLIDHLRGGESFNSIFLQLPEDSHFILASISILELFSGKSSRKSKIENEIEKFLTNFEVVDIDKKISKRAGILIRDSKITIGLADNIIAATAIETGAQVVTLNKKHFSKIPGLSIYPI